MSLEEIKEYLLEDDDLTDEKDLIYTMKNIVEFKKKRIVCLMKSY